MRDSFAHLLRCPGCRQSFSLTVFERGGEDIREGSLSCNCGRTFPVIQGVPQMWSLSLMKCAIELTAQSFPSNLKELEEHGHFPPGSGAE